MSEFVDECRREWRRLGVPDPIANEMAADLSADLHEAEAEGGSPEDVLGNSAFDPRRFAAAWATARGVTGPPVSNHPTLWRPAVATALTIVLVALTVVAGVALFGGATGSAVAVVAPHFARGPEVFAPGRILLPGPFGGLFGTPVVHNVFRPVALLLLIVGLVGLGLLVFLYWFRRPGSRRFRRYGGRGTPTWN